MDNTNTKSIPASQPAQVNAPPSIKSYAQSIHELTGLHIDSQTIERAASELNRCMLTDDECLCIFYLAAVEATLKALRQVTMQGRSLAPLSIWDAAGQVRAEAEQHLESRVKTRHHLYASCIPPRMTKNEFKTVKLLPGVSYRLTNDHRNIDAISLLVGPEGIPKVISPGESIVLDDEGTVDVMGAVEPSIMQWERVGGTVDAGNLSGTIPMPKVGVQKPVAAKASKATKAKRRWLW